ncbi:MAG: hypothetical protein ACFFAS_10990 [Promethearchaeota archaeon]
MLLGPFLSGPYGRIWAILVSGPLIFILYYTKKNSKFKILGKMYNEIGEVAEEKLKRFYLQGPFHYCVSITFLVVIFVIVGFWEDQMYLPISRR